MIITGSVRLRLRVDDANIHFEASVGGSNWVDTYSEPFGLPGYTLDHAFYYELAGYNTENHGVLVVDDFSVELSSGSSTALSKGASTEEDHRSVPERFSLSQNYPNPFNLETRWNLDVPEAGRVEALVFDVWGRLVIRLADEEFQAGSHILRWSGSNQAGEIMSTGTYALRVTFITRSGHREVSIRRLILVK